MMLRFISKAALRSLLVYIVTISVVVSSPNLYWVLLNFQTEVWPWIALSMLTLAAFIPLAVRAFRRWGTEASALDVTLLVAPLLLAYSLMAIPLRRTDAWEWFDTLLATVFSVVAAVATGIQLMKHQKNSAEASRLGQLNLLLQQELKEVTETLNAQGGLPLILADGPRKINTAQLRLVAVEDAIRSGLYENTSSAMMRLVRLEQTRGLEITYLYQALAGGLTNDVQKKVVAHIANNLDKNKANILGLAKNLLAELDR